MIRSVRGAICAAVAAFLAGCAGVPAPPVAPGVRMEASGPVAPFSTIDRIDASGRWVAWRMHPTKRPTEYRLVTLGGERVLEARADRAVSGLKHVLDVDPTERPMLEWRWKAEGAIAGADVGDRHGDDAPVRIVLAFDGDKSTLPLKEQMFFERVRLLAGHDMPYAMLMYVWDGRREPGTVTQNAHTSRIRKIVVESGAEGVGKWLAYRRDIVADYERAYGKAPGRLRAIAVMTDSDNTRQKVRGWYGDIRLLERP